MDHSISMTHGTVQAELYRRLRNHDVPVVCEASFPTTAEASNSRKLQPDMTVLRGDDVLCFAEVKQTYNGKYNIGPYREGDECPTNQVRNYVTLGRPVFVCMNWEAVDATFRSIMDLVCQ